MALGALVKGKIKASNTGPIIHARVDIPLDNSYPTGGYPAAGGFQALVQAVLGMPGFTIMDLGWADFKGLIPQYDPTNDKLMLFRCGGANADMAEVVAAQDLSAKTLKLWVRGF